MADVMLSQSRALIVPPRTRDAGAAPAAGDPAGAARQDLPMRYPIRHGMRRRKRWWRTFMSPVWLALAAPALLLPLGVIFLFEDDAAPSMVEQAISALPIPGDASEPGQGADAARVAALGRGPAVPSTVSATLYSTSARADAARLARRSEPRDAVPDIATTSYALLHPRSLADEDLLIGEYAMLVSMPGVPDFSWAIFQSYCQAPRNAGERKVTLAQLPINREVPAAIVNFLPASEHSKLCPRLG
jgi:hypothetical protein